MKIAVIGDEVLKQELTATGIVPGVEISWHAEPVEIAPVSACIDLLFQYDPERIKQLQILSPLCIVSSVENTLQELPTGFARINGWNSFLKNILIEGSASEKDKAQTEEVFSCFQKKIEWVPDIPGFITPRVISMIINEAYFSLDENVSSREEIDTAMKLGTNYPFGPFEWSEKIGLRKIYNLLKKLSEINKRYNPSSLLEKEVLQES